jgi:OOP family OmpA-OmpF porin
MTRSIPACVLFILLSAAASAASAAPPEEHPYIRPIPGFELWDSEFRNFTAETFEIEDQGRRTKREVKGKHWSLVYEYEGDREYSPLEIIENYRQAALEKRGRVLSEDDVNLQFTVPIPEGGTAWAHLWAKRNYYELDIVDEEAFEKRLTFGAEQMKRALDDAGRVAVYGIHFDFDKASLKPGAEQVLVEMVKLMKQNPGLSVEIQGHTDSVGGRSYNLGLSERRARTVKRFLELYGVEDSRMRVRGYGPDRPVASNETEEGRALNRRVELERL